MAKIKSLIRYFIPYGIIELRSRYKKKKERSLNCCSYNIIKHPNSVLDIVFKVKENTWERTYYPELFRHTKEQSLDVLNYELYYYRIPNAIINGDSDIIITKHGVLWDKYNEEEFITWAKPADYNLIEYSKDNITISKAAICERISGNSLSLAGTWSYAWSHFMFQFLTKLYFAGENHLLDNDIKILVNEYQDRNNLEMIEAYIRNYPKAKIVFLKRGVDYICENLYFMPSTSPSFNDHHFRLDYPYIVPKCVLDRIDKYVVSPTINKIKGNNQKYKKLFLGRGKLRTLTNYEEIHDYFIHQGFVEIDGATLSIEEKADIFYHAEIIVGLYGSSMQNFIFCNNAKCLILTNYKMSTDACIYEQARRYVKKWINVAGQDESSYYHSNFTIDINKVKDAYNYLLNIQ